LISGDLQWTAVGVLWPPLPDWSQASRWRRDRHAGAFLRRALLLLIFASRTTPPASSPAHQAALWRWDHSLSASARGYAARRRHRRAKPLVRRRFQPPSGSL